VSEKKLDTRFMPCWSTQSVGTLWFVFLFGVPAALAGALDDNLQSALRGAYALPGAELALSVQLDTPVPSELEPFADNARFANLMLDKTSGRFALIALLPSGAPAAQLSLSGQVTAMAEVPVLRDMVTRGQLVEQALIDYALVPANRLAGGSARPPAVPCIRAGRSGLPI